VISTTEAAQKLGVTSQTVRRWYAAGILRGQQVMRPRGAIKIEEDSVRAVLAQREESPS
jgi:excisionase family DNA binding protein